MFVHNIYTHTHIRRHAAFGEPHSIGRGADHHLWDYPRRCTRFPLGWVPGVCVCTRILQSMRIRALRLPLGWVPVVRACVYIILIGICVYSIYVNIYVYIYIYICSSTTVRAVVLGWVPGVCVCVCARFLLCWVLGVLCVYINTQIRICIYHCMHTCIYAHHRLRNYSCLYERFPLGWVVGACVCVCVFSLWVECMCVCVWVYITFLWAECYLGVYLCVGVYVCRIYIYYRPWDHLHRCVHYPLGESPSACVCVWYVYIDVFTHTRRHIRSARYL